MPDGERLVLLFINQTYIIDIYLAAGTMAGWVPPGQPSGRLTCDIPKPLSRKPPAALKATYVIVALVTPGGLLECVVQECCPSFFPGG